jgi:membrane protein involved in colicin uptake
MGEEVCISYLGDLMTALPSGHGGGRGGGNDDDEEDGDDDEHGDDGDDRPDDKARIAAAIRRELLREQYLFECQCDLCTRQQGGSSDGTCL